MTVACVLRKSSEFDSDYVLPLLGGVDCWLSDFNFVCLSNVDVPCDRIPLLHDYPGYWSKIELCRPDIIGDLLYIDLDTVIVGNLTEIASTQKFTMLEDFFFPQHLASGFMFLTEAARSRIWEAWMKVGPGAVMLRYKNFVNNVRGDQGFIGEVFAGETVQKWQEVLPGQVISYKAHVRKPQHRRFEHGDGSIPPNARAVCFHGKPRPRDVGWRV